MKILLSLDRVITIFLIFLFNMPTLWLIDDAENIIGKNMANRLTIPYPTKIFRFMSSRLNMNM